MTGPDKGKSPLPAVLVMFTVIGSMFAAYQILESGKPKFRALPPPVKVMRPVTVTGEVVDAWCYASQTMGPGRGPGHRACAIACVSGGVSVGILEDGTGKLFVGAKSHGFKGCNELLLPYIGEKVTVVGHVGELGGCRMLKIQSVTPLKPIDLNP